MKKENLEPAIKLANKIKNLEEQIAGLGKAIKLNGDVDFYAIRSDGNGCYYPKIDCRFFNFNVMKTLALEEMEKELTELKRQFEAL